MIDNLKDLYENQIKDKRDYESKVSEHFKVSVHTVRTGWFIKWILPTKYRLIPNLLEFTQNYIKLQNEK